MHQPQPPPLPRDPDVGSVRDADETSGHLEGAGSVGKVRGSSWGNPQSTHYGAVNGVQVVRDWLPCPRHGALQRGQLHHAHDGANVCNSHTHAQAM